MLEQIKNIYGIKATPFTKIIAAADLFESSCILEACARFEVALESEEVSVLTGAPGTGKSCIIRKLKSLVDETKYRVLYIAGEFKKPGEIIKHLLHLMNEPVPFHASRALREFKKKVQHAYTTQNLKTVVIVDEAQDLPIETLSELKSILNYEMDSQNYLFLLLCGQPELKEKLNIATLASLKRRVRINLTTVPLSLLETINYIRHQMRIVGVERQLFSDEAVVAIFEYSKGSISKINSLSFMALIKAAAEKREIIDPGLIESVRLQA